MNNYEDEEIVEDGETVRVSLMMADSSIRDKLIMKDTDMNMNDAKTAMNDARNKAIADLNAWRDGATSARSAPSATATGSGVTIHDHNRHLFDSSHIANAKRRCDDAYARSVASLNGGL